MLFTKLKISSTLMLFLFTSRTQCKQEPEQTLLVVLPHSTDKDSHYSASSHSYDLIDETYFSNEDFDNPKHSQNYKKERSDQTVLFALPISNTEDSRNPSSAKSYDLKSVTPYSNENLNEFHEKEDITFLVDSCPHDVDNQEHRVVEEVITYTYSLESIINANNLTHDEMFTRREGLINRVETIIHESQVSKWLKCLSDGASVRHLIRGLQEGSEILPPSSITSFPKDELLDVQCNVNSMIDAGNDCFLVEGKFILSFSVDINDANTQANIIETWKKSEDLIKEKMTDGTFVNTANNNDRGIDDTTIVNLMYLSESDWTTQSAIGNELRLESESQRRTIIGSVIPLTVLVIALFSVRQLHKRKNAKGYVDLPKSSSDWFCEEEETEIEIMVAKKTEDRIRKDARRLQETKKCNHDISSCNGKLWGDLDVHTCQSALCRSCRLKKKTTFLPVDHLPPVSKSEIENWRTDEKPS